MNDPHAIKPIGQLLQSQIAKVPLVGGPRDGKFTAPAPDDGAPHCCCFHAPPELQDSLPLHLVVYFYTWNNVKRQWDFYSIEKFRHNPAIQARMREIVEKGSHA